MEEEVMMQELPCKSSDSPSTKNLKRRSTSAVYCLPPGCSCTTPSQYYYFHGKTLPLDVSLNPVKIDEELEGVIPPVEMQLDEEQNRNSSHEAGVTIEEGHAGEPIVTGGQSGKSVLENDGASDQWWMGSKLYPPPKRRKLSAIHHYSVSCGRDRGTNGNHNKAGEAGQDVSVDNNSDTSQHKVVKSTKIKIPSKGRTEEASKETTLFSRSQSERAKERTCSNNKLASKKSPMKNVFKKKVCTRASKSTPRSLHIDKRAQGNENLEDYASRAILQSRPCSSRVPAKKSVLDFDHPCPKNIKLGKTVDKKSIPLSQASSSGLNEHRHNGYFRHSKDNKPTDPRGKVMRCMRLFEIKLQKLLQQVKSSNKLEGMERNRVDLKVARIMREQNETLNRDKPIVGSVPGVEIGDEYRYRTEPSVLGVHRPLRAGIDSTMRRGIRVATSIVVSGGYPDHMENENVLIYTGAGGQPTGKPGHTLPRHQKLERGNLALKKSIDMKTPVRVIYGQKIGKSGKVMKYTYDGLYKVEKLWLENQTRVVKGANRTVTAFRFQLRRLEGQPKLNWSKLEKVKKSARRAVLQG